MLDSIFVSLVVKDGLSMNAVCKSVALKTLVSLAKRDTEISIPSRGTLTTRILAEYELRQAEIKKLIERAQWVSLTIDIWSSSKCGARSFLGVTCHFFDTEGTSFCVVCLSEKLCFGQV